MRCFSLSAAQGCRHSQEASSQERDVGAGAGIGAGTGVRGFSASVAAGMNVRMRAENSTVCPDLGKKELDAMADDIFKKAMTWAPKVPNLPASQFPQTLKS